MRLGFLTQLTEQECKLAARIGYDCIEALGKWEVEELKKKDFVKTEAEKVKTMLQQSGISISAIAIYFGGPTDPKGRVERYELYMKMCRALGVHVITTMTGGAPDKSLEENLDEFEAVFSKVAARGEESGVKVAFENWPGLGSTFPPISSCNFGFTPQVWEQMFNRVDSEWIGLEFDPSHLVWQWADWALALKKFITKVHHVHAKDTEVFADCLAAGGTFSSGWWRYRLPGYGVVDWHKLTSLLKEGGYSGGVCVEHEDPVFSGERREEGLEKAHAYLRPLV